MTGNDDTRNPNTRWARAELREVDAAPLNIGWVGAGGVQFTDGSVGYYVTMLPNGSLVYSTAPPQPMPTPEQLAERERDRQARLRLQAALQWSYRMIAVREAQAQRERIARAEAAAERGRMLLRQVLTPHQWRMWKKRESFYVTGSAGGRYRINKGYSGNVEAITRRGKHIGHLCAAPAYWLEGQRLPVEDVVAGQALHLATDELGWLELSNLQGGEYPENWFRTETGRAYLKDMARAARGDDRIAGCACPGCSGAWGERQRAAMAFLQAHPELLEDQHEGTRA